MAHGIHPTADYAFKLLFGTEENKDLLLHFLNSILQLDVPIQEIVLVNPFIPSEFKGDDQTVVDVQARDEMGRILAIEIQNQVRPILRRRVVYTLANLYQAQLREGGDFATLRPTHCVWILNQNLLGGETEWLHHFQLRDRAGLLLSDHLNLHTVELQRWTHPVGPLATADQWVYFLREAGSWSQLPQELRSPQITRAMATMTRISEKTADYARYQARENFLREQRTLQKELEMDRAELAQVRLEREQALTEKEQALAEKEQERGEKEQAFAELEALKVRLRAAGLDAD